MQGIPAFRAPSGAFRVLREGIDWLRRCMRPELDDVGENLLLSFLQSSSSYGIIAANRFYCLGIIMSSPKFCTSCGSPLEPGQIFCTACGAPVDSNEPIQGGSVCPSSSGPETVQMPYVHPSSPSSTSPMPAVHDDAARQYRQPEFDSPSSSQGDGANNRKILIAVIAVLAVILCVLVGVLLGNALGGSGGQDSSAGSSSAQSSQSTSSSEATSANSSSASTQSNQSQAEQSLYNQLSSYYSKLGNYDTQIASCASTFNSNFLKKDMATRRAYAKEAESLLSQVKSDYSALQSLSVPSSSVNRSSYNTMVTCYNDCVQRISVICESWTNSLSYADPTSHEDAICAPLSRDKVGDSNKYYTEFQQNYPNAKPVSPSN